MIQFDVNSPDGKFGFRFLSGNANTCATIVTDTIVGHCAIAGGTINYYNTDWSIGSSQSDCAAEPGTWSN